MQWNGVRGVAVARGRHVPLPEIRATLQQRLLNGFHIELSRWNVLARSERGDRSRRLPSGAARTHASRAGLRRSR